MLFGQARLKKTVTTRGTAKIIGLTLNNSSNSLSLGEVSLTKWVFNHHIIDLGYFFVFLSLCGGFPRSGPRLEEPIAKID
jgi:hypothetical protein